MNLTIEPHVLTAHDVPSLLTAQRDAAMVSSAADAIVTLRLLTAHLTEADLVRRAITMPAGAEWLAALGADAQALMRTLYTERAIAKAVLLADSAVRFRLDHAAVERLMRAEADLREHQAAVRGAGDRYGEVRQALAAAGTPEAEVEAYVAKRLAEAIASSTASLEAAQAVVVAIKDYLSDPLRDVDRLGADLAHELAELTDAYAALADGGTTGLDLSVKVRE